MGAVARSARNRRLIRDRSFAMPDSAIAIAARQLASGTATSVSLVDAALARATDARGEGGRVFTRLYADRARAEAAAMDALRASGTLLSPLMGIPVSIKDLFDVAGETTCAGSRFLAQDPPAATDAVAVARLRRAGAVVIGRTAMTELAFSGIGLNPHTGTPANPWDRATGRIPGGSSSGAAVSVGDGMAFAAIATDTGGSVRIPAALCGLTGFKPTQARVPRTGCYPLSPSFDSIGPIARTVGDCALVDAVLADEPVVLPPPADPAGLRFLLPANYVGDDLDPEVATAFEAALSHLSGAGVRIVERRVPVLDEIPASFVKGGLPAAEIAAHLGARLEAVRDAMDPRVLARILPGAAMTAAEYIGCLRARAAMIAAADALTGHVDAMIMPTTAGIAPPIATLEADDAAFRRANYRMLRNTGIANVLDRCALSLPCHAPGTAPVGLMLVGARMQDRRLLGIGLAVEAVLGPR